MNWRCLLGRHKYYEVDVEQGHLPYRYCKHCGKTQSYSFYLDEWIDD